LINTTNSPLEYALRMCVLTAADVGGGLEIEQDVTVNHHNFISTT